MLAVAHDTYQDYVAYNRARGYGAFPESLWNALKAEEEDIMEAEETAHLELVQRLAGKVC